MEEITKLIQTLLNNFGYSFLAQHAKLAISIVTALLIPAAPAVWKSGRWAYKYHLNRRLAKDLHPFYTPIDIKKATEYYVSTKCQNISPSKEHEPRETHAFATKENIIPFFLKKAFKMDKDYYRFYIILADSGMGKTTLMINLYLKYKSQFFGKDYAIRLIPLGHPDIDMELDKIPDKIKEKTILLLDAFDEDNKAIQNYKTRMEEIIKKVWRFREVLITCRTQFFPTEEEEPKETGIFRFGGEKGELIFRKLYISPFDDKDIKKYIHKIFSLFHLGKKRRAWRIVQKSPHLMVRPMLLSWIDDLLEGEQEYKFTYFIYRDLIIKWIDREAKRVPSENRERFKIELYDFSRAIALDIYRNRPNRGGMFIGGEDINPFAENHGITLEDMEMKSRSLLNRNARHEYKFAHKSILEYFLAFEAAKDTAFKRELSFDGMDMARKFYEEMIFENVMSFFNSKIFSGTYEFNLRKEILISKLKNIGSLEELRKIQSMSLQDNQIVDISVLKELKGLQSLDLSRNKITDISVLKELKGLQSLDLSNNKITDISDLKELKGLQSLDLSNNKITDISMLKELKSLQSLDLNSNKIMDISALKELKSLQSLDLSSNKIADISVLKELKDLQNLILNFNKIKNISALNELKGLQSLWLTDNQITDISALKELQSLQYLALKFNKIVDISALEELKNLQYLVLSYNKIKDISALKELKGLQALLLTDNQITDISALKELKGLQFLLLTNNQIKDISALKESKSLRYLELTYNQIKNMTTLKELKSLLRLDLFKKEVK